MEKSRTVFSGKLLKVERREQKLPGGRIARIEIIRHPGAALIVPFVDKNTVILLRQYRPVLKQYLYEFPAGTKDPGETPLACARREIVEETGHRAARLKKIGRIHPVPGYSTEVITIFAAEGLSEKRGKLDADEVLTPIRMTRPQVLRLVRSGKISDAKTLCALALCGWL